jgi:hypothetical protein
MVQVDVFWSYGLNAGLAIAASQTLAKEQNWFESKAFLMALLWTVLFFVPSGMFLLWINPGWETMFLAREHTSIPAWLVCLFSVTNVTQGILGFAVTAILLKKNMKRAAWLQVIGAHFAMFFILIVGWDGAGYQRFFYAGDGIQWHNNHEFAFSDFFGCTIFYSLVGLGVVLIPSYVYLIRKLQRLP